MSQGFHPERESSDLKKVKAVEENGEDAEPIRNGAESVSEGEGIDANSGSTDSSGEGVTFPFKPGKCILSSCVHLSFFPLFCRNIREMLPLSSELMDGRKKLIAV